MTAAKPYTPEEWAELDGYLWECLEDADRARIIATVQALAEERAARRAQLQVLEGQRAALAAELEAQGRALAEAQARVKELEEKLDAAEYAAMGEDL